MAYRNMILTLTFVLSFLYLTSTTLADDEYGLDKTAFTALITAEYAGGKAKENIFLDHMWSKITEALFPPNVVTPYLKVKYANFDDCLKETHLNPRLGEITQKVPDYSDGKIKLEIGSEFEINPNQPMLFDYIIKYHNEGLSPLQAKLCFKFVNRNVLKLVLETVDFSEAKERISAKCLVTVKNLEVIEMSNPVKDECEDKDDAMAKSDLKLVSDADNFYAIMSEALIRGINDRVGKQNNFWIYLSEEFKLRVSKTRFAYEKYSEEYQAFCSV